MNVGTFTYESGPSEYEDFPHTEEPVYILGKVYSAEYDRDDLKDDIRSRLWITYRRNFPNIGGMGPSSDQGWGCMLRCGQMMLAQALMLKHLGRNWKWRQEREDETYWKLLKMFQDKKTAIYSIHQIASMGEAEGKSIGQWFGPNTIAQVLKRISVFDEWSQIAIHVAMDNVVILDEVRALCKPSPGSLQPAHTNGDLPGVPNGAKISYFVNEVPVNEIAQQPSQGQHSPLPWKPLLLIIPLRLGLTEINPIYFDALKKCFSLRQSVGIIGGKPNHAHWFIGYFGRELIYLDPHTTHNVVDLEGRGQSDTSYHCVNPPCRMSFQKLDPSIALGFFCNAESDFDDLCDAFNTSAKECRPMFEVRKDAPHAYFRDIAMATAGTADDGTETRNRQSSFAGEFTLVSNNNCLDGGSSMDDEEFEII